MRKMSIIFGSLIAVSALQASPTIAAPQILAVMAAFGPQEMQCSASACTTTLTSYCLQRERDVPTTGQAYLPAHPDLFKLIVTDADGKDYTMPADGNVSFKSSRGYSMVTAVVGNDVMDQFDGVTAKIVPAKGASLIPVPVAGDSNPISEAELAFATRSLREHGEDIVDAHPNAQAAQIVNRIAATIVPKLPASQQRLDQLWHDVIDGLGTVKPAGQDAIKRARDIYDWCKNRSSYHSMGGIKSCLEFKHDDAIMKLNTDYWDSQPGY